MRKILLFILSLASVLPVTPVTILVHGTFACGVSWYQPRSQFFEGIRVTLVAERMGVAPGDTAVVPFTWTGANNHNARIDAATSLAATILSYPQETPITLIGHSHGGNVISLATRLLFNPLSQQENVKNPEEFVSSYIQNEVQNYLKEIETPESRTNYLSQLAIARNLTESFNVIQNRYKQLAKEQEEKENAAALPEVDTLSKKLTFTGEENNTQTSKKKTPAIQRVVSRVFMLGTPIDQNTYNINLKVAQLCYSIYSTGDMVQQVGGLYKRTFPPRKRLLNIRANMINLHGSKETFGHSELHTLPVARYLLSLPERISRDLNITPDDYSEYPEIKVTFFENGQEPIIRHVDRSKELPTGFSEYPLHDWGIADNEIVARQQWDNFIRNLLDEPVLRA